MEEDKKSDNSINKIISLCKRRGFVFPGSEIYGGLANTYDYGPLGAELLLNIKNLWWKHFVNKRGDVFGLHSCVLMNPKVWEASGHTASFTDVLLDCKECQNRTRADHLIEDYFKQKGKEIKIEGFSLEKISEIIQKEKIPCPSCRKFNWTEPRKFNLLFETHIGIVPKNKSLAYLRGEIAQGMFINFKNVLDSLFPDLPFGLAQSGAAFRNEITLGNFIFRTLQFNLAEFEYFFNPEKQSWEDLFEYWKKEMFIWTTKILGIKEKNLRWRKQADEERSHYSKRTEDLEYNFPFGGFNELYGLAYRTDFDLKNHMQKSGIDLRYTDKKTGEKFIPHVVEPTFGMDRSLLAVLIDSYLEEKIKKEKRIVLKLPRALAPYKVAVFPLLANKPELVGKARQVYDILIKEFSTAWDARGNIGKRYYSQDEIGTPFCVTIDFDTLEKNDVTIRDRDSMVQERVKINKLVEVLKEKLKS
jgi:glycyl-tRNA synthetase